MSQCETLHPDQILPVLKQACKEHAHLTASFFFNGKWHVMKLNMDEVTIDQIVLADIQEKINTYQPVGIYIISGQYKYLFDTQVEKVQAASNGYKIHIAHPQSLERMPRRSYLRQPVPGSLNVKVLFWHRGYVEGAEQPHKPAEQYWQGRLVNLSAGGAQFEIQITQKEHFSSNQLLGVQFTPMSYQKPLLLDSLVKYLKDDSRNGHFRIGVEFLGLETPEGRQILHRLLEIVGRYEHLNHPEKSSESAS